MKYIFVIIQQCHETALTSLAFKVMFKCNLQGQCVLSIMSTVTLILCTSITVPQLVGQSLHVMHKLLEVS